MEAFPLIPETWDVSQLFPSYPHIDLVPPNDLTWLPWEFFCSDATLSFALLKGWNETWLDGAGNIAVHDLLGGSKSWLDPSHLRQWGQPWDFM